MNELDLMEFTIIDKKSNEHDYLFTVECNHPPFDCSHCLTPYVGDNEGKYYIHGNRERFVRDLNMLDKRVGINIIQKRFKCLLCGKTFWEQYNSINSRDKMTIRLREKLKELSLKEPFLQIAEEYGLSSNTVKRAFDEYVAEKEHERQGLILTPKILGLDEAHLNSKYRAVITNVGEKKIIDVLPKRTKATITKYLNELPKKDNIKTVVIDMWQPYKDSVKDVLGDVPIVIDKFHVIKEGNNALDKFRKTYKSTLRDSQRRKLKKDRFTLLKNKENLTDLEIMNRDIWFTTFPLLKVAYELKEGLRDIYKAKSRQEAELLYWEWKRNIPSDIPQFYETVNTIDNWYEEIFNYFDNPYTNAFTESMNNLIKEIEKNGRGYTFDVLRAKILFSTKATKKPKYGTLGFNKYSYNIFNGVAESMFIYNQESWGVEISTLLEILKQGEF